VSKALACSTYSKHVDDNRDCGHDGRFMTSVNR